MMNKFYKIKINWLQILIFCSFVKVYFFKKIYSILISNIADLILLRKIYNSKKKGRQIYLHYLQFKNIRTTSRLDYTVLLRRQISNYSMKKKTQFIFKNKLKYFDL